MLVPVVLAFLSALLAASLVLLGQGIAARRAEQRLGLAKGVYEYASKHGGVVTARDIAPALSLTLADADKLLRRMVDDRQFTMGIDERAAVVRFWYPDLVAQARAAYASRSASSGSRANGSTSSRGASARHSSIS